MAWACARAPVPPAPRPPPRSYDEAVKPFVEKARESLRAEEERLWQTWTRGVDSPDAGTMDSSLSAAEWKDLQGLAALAKGPEQDASFKRLKTYFAGEHASRAVAPLTEAAGNLRASLTFYGNAKEQRFRDLDSLLASEPSAPKRQGLWIASSQAASRLGQALRRREEKLESELVSLGYRSYAQFGAELREEDLKALRELAERTLRSTKDAYSQTLEAMKRREGAQAPQTIHRADLPRLFRLSDEAAAFPKATQLQRAKETFLALGFDVDKVPGLKLESSEAPERRGSVLCLALEIPNDVRVSIKPDDGLFHQLSVVHELAHGLHYVHLTEPRFELKKLGNPSRSEALALLLEHLVHQSSWLEEVAKLDAATRERISTALKAESLYRLRHAAATFLYDEARRRPNANVSKLHRELGEALGTTSIEGDTAREMLDATDFYASADALRSRVQAGQMARALEEELGPMWWRKKEAGEKLKKWWASRLGEPVSSPRRGLRHRCERAEDLTVSGGSLHSRYSARCIQAWAGVSRFEKRHPLGVYSSNLDTGGTEQNGNSPRPTLPTP